MCQRHWNRKKEKKMSVFLTPFLLQDCTNMMYCFVFGTDTVPVAKSYILYFTVFLYIYRLLIKKQNSIRTKYDMETQRPVLLKQNTSFSFLQKVACSIILLGFTTALFTQYKELSVGMKVSKDIPLGVRRNLMVRTTLQLSEI